MTVAGRLLNAAGRTVTVAGRLLIAAGRTETVAGRLLNAAGRTVTVAGSMSMSMMKALGPYQLDFLLRPFFDPLLNLFDIEVAFDDHFPAFNVDIDLLDSFIISTTD